MSGEADGPFYLGTSIRLRHRRYLHMYSFICTLGGEKPYPDQLHVERTGVGGVMCISEGAYSCRTIKDSMP